MEQKLFNQIIQGLRKQGERAYDHSRHICMYRTIDDPVRKCAFGQLIPDEIYSSNMEGMPLGALISHFPILMTVPGLEGIKGENPKMLLTLMQRAHDKMEPSKWEETWAVIAELFNLHVPSKEPTT